MSDISNDRLYMQRAIELARRGMGSVHPNPPVGAVVVRDGQILGEGFHQKAGGVHAEVAALDQAASEARGSILYVTLEPCNHTGRTPPCTEAIIRAGIREVVYGSADPNPNVAGGGHARLEREGIVVRSGILREQTNELIRFFAFALRENQPYVIAKFAASLDGRLATRTGESQWITGETARHRAHQLRSEVDAILIGAGTAILDNPRLTVRLTDYKGNQPVRIVMDSSGLVPPESNMFADGHCILATSARIQPDHRAKLLEKGVQVWELPEDKLGRVSMPEVIRELGVQGYQSVLVEGGATILGSVFDEGLVDEVWAFMAPVIIGGESAPGAVGGMGVERMNDALRLKNVTTEQLGSDLLIRGRKK